MEVFVLYDVVMFEKCFECEWFDLIVLDLMMLGVDGLIVLCQLCVAGDDIFVIMLIVWVDDVDCIVGFEFGVDDYFGKLFNLCELFVCVQVVLCCCCVMLLVVVFEQCELFVFGCFLFDFQVCMLLVDGKLVMLLSSEFVLLKIFVNYVLCMFMCEWLFELLYGFEYDGIDCGIDVQVWCLCCIFEMDLLMLCFIQMVCGCGYVFVFDGEVYV